MSIDPNKLHILSYPAEALRRKAARVAEITDEVRAVTERMFELMAEADGVGLAAPQVGLSWRLFVTREEDEVPPRVFINPAIRVVEGVVEVSEEGCLSLPGVRVNVRRPEHVAIVATDLEGNGFELNARGLSARVWQHEFDHLNGILIIDRMGPMDRLANRKVIRDLKASASA